jgi:hypothetical protein
MTNISYRVQKYKLKIKLQGLLLLQSYFKPEEKPL